MTQGDADGSTDIHQLHVQVDAEIEQAMADEPSATPDTELQAYTSRLRSLLGAVAGLEEYESGHHD